VTALENRLNLERTSHSHVYLRDFWKSESRYDYLPNFHGDVTKSFLVSLLSELNPAADYPIVINSVFHHQSLVQRTLNKIKGNRTSVQDSIRSYGHLKSSPPIDGFFNIWYTGENLRPPLFEPWSHFFSFDIDDYNVRNTYLPLWITRLAPDVAGAKKKQSELTKMRDLNLNDQEREKFCAVIGNPEIIRMHFIESIQKQSQLDVFGKLGDKTANKHSTLQKYNFNVCFESDLYPGYVTEKAIESWISGCIPIWRGLDHARTLNPKAIIDVTGLKVNEAVEKVIEVSRNADLVNQMKSEPIIQSQIDIDAIVGLIGSKYRQR